MTSPYQMFGTNKALEAEKGVTIDYGSFSITVLRAGNSNRKYLERLTAKMRPYRTQKKMDPDVSRRLLAEVYAEAVIVGWKDVKDASGNSMEFTRENCVKLLIDLPDMFDDLVRFAEDMRNFQTEQVEEETKN